MSEMIEFGPACIEKIVDLDPFVLPSSLLLPDHDLAELRHEAELLSPDHVDFEVGNLLISLHSFLLRVNGLNILIDSCVGEHKPRPRRDDWNDRRDTGYLDSLARAGLSPGDVDIVMCTHLHADHVGWNTRLENGRWVPTFPNARYVIGKTELDHWVEQEKREPGLHNHGAFNDSVLPVIEAGLAETVEDGVSIAPHMNILPLAGHSPGQIGLTLDCGRGGHAVFCGDALHSPVHVFRPDWSTAFCHDPAEAARTRRHLLTMAADDDTLLLPAHMRMAHGMRIRRDGAGFRPVMV